MFSGQVMKMGNALAVPSYLSNVVLSDFPLFFELQRHHLVLCQEKDIHSLLGFRHKELKYQMKILVLVFLREILV